MSEGPDDKLTAGAHLAAILSIDVRPNGKLEGTIRDAAHSYRFSGLKALPGAVLRWLAEEVGGPVGGVNGDRRSGDDGTPPPRSADGAPPCR